MNVNLLRCSRVVAVAAALLGLGLVGCSSNKSPSDERTASSRAAAPSGQMEHGKYVEAIKPAGTVSEIWTQITDEQTKMATAIQTGRLQDVHHLAYGIRDLVVALADKTNAGSPASAARLTSMVEQVKASAIRLDASGDSGNLSATQTEYAKLETFLNAIKSITGANH